MAFKMHCPKCGGLDFSIERDNRTFGAVAQAYELVFHCRCGKQLFGEVLLKEYEQQKKAFETGGDAFALQGTPDARVERIEDRLRSGKKTVAVGDDGVGRLSAGDRRWKAQLTKGFDDEDDDREDDDDDVGDAVAPAKSAAKRSKPPVAAKAKPRVKEPRPAKRKAAEPVAKSKAAARPKSKKKAPLAKARPTRLPARKKVAPARPRKDTRRPTSTRVGAASAARLRAGSAARLKAAAKTAARNKPARAGGAKVKVAAKGRGREVHGTCIWPGCGKPTRANSKYCSRACSNKNARSRHKTRVRKSVTKKSPRTVRSVKGR